jgi:hypothetical protein
MGKLKLSSIGDEKPVKVTVELSAALHGDLTRYAELLSAQSGQAISEPSRLIAPMLERFIGTDREFARSRRSARTERSKQ